MNQSNFIVFPYFLDLFLAKNKHAIDKTCHIIIIHIITRQKKHKLVYDVSHIKIIAAFTCTKTFKIKYHQFVEPISDIILGN